jgi:dTDP-glucose pyrophosphorylase
MKPTLLILAAGMGSRYGGIKQITPIGPNGEPIIQYSIFDAIRNGFDKIVFIIRKEIENDFRETIVSRLPENINVEFVYQELTDIPIDVEIPSERKKPWGTGHALLAARNAINEPFLIINADDFYGADSYKIAAEFLREAENSENLYGLIGYKLINTLSDFGSVSRGVCEIDDEGYLQSVVERTEIVKENGSIKYKDENGEWQSLTGEEIVSMNMFAFTPKVFQYFNDYFIAFLKENAQNPKAEFYIPFVVNELIKNGTAKVKVPQTSAEWFGLTYKEDTELARAKMRELIEEGIYPEKLWT